MRRAASKNRRRLGDWTAYATDEAFQERHDADERFADTTGSLLAKFNRLARDLADEPGQDADVCGFEGTRVLVRSREGLEIPCEVRRILKKQLTGVRSPISIGDAVRFQYIESSDQQEGVVVALLPRRNFLARTDSHNRALLHVFAANIDRMVIVASAAMPDLRPALIDRYLLISHAFDVQPVIVINKCDLTDSSATVRLYQDLGYPVHCTACRDTAGADLDGLRSSLAGGTCVFAGQSGVGKSSLIKALAPEQEIRIGAVSEVQQKGRHTTIAARSYRLPPDITLIDTPGIRECGIPALAPLDVALLYRDIARYHPECRFPNCSHIHEPDCAVQTAVKDGRIARSRYESYRAILAEDLVS
ncbi:MAG: ribosome small subunit-dependent GTPase A [Planctomycetota bacterium]